MTSQAHDDLPCDSGTNTFEAQLSPLVKILWPLSVVVLCSLRQLLFTGTQCLRKTSHGDPRMRWILGWSWPQLELHLTTSLNHLSWSWEPRGLGARVGWGLWFHQGYDSSSRPLRSSKLEGLLGQGDEAEDTGSAPGLP